MTPSGEVTTAERIDQVRERMAAAAARSGRPASCIQLVAVTKRVASERIREAYLAGIRVAGENYVQEAQKKQAALKDMALEWHLIGRLQTNKARSAGSLFRMVETVDRAEIAEALSKSARGGGNRLPVLIQVWLGGDVNRAGVLPDDLPKLIHEVRERDGLRLRGLMGVAPPGGDAGQTRKSFALLRSLWERGPDVALSSEDAAAWDTLSMGMSSDFEIAIEEGATSVRIGTAIFGARPA